MTIALPKHYPSAEVEIYWPVSLTANINEHLEVHDSIEPHHTFEVVVLSENYGLVTWTIRGRIERLGIILLQGRHEDHILATWFREGRPSRASQELTKVDIFSLLTHFPGSRKQVMLS
jgi:hypothetical protein